MGKFNTKLFASIITGMSLLAWGVLSFVAMYAIAPVLPLCIIAFFLGTFLDETNYWKGIYKGIQSLSFRFDALHLKRGIARHFLKKFLTSSYCRENLFLYTYKKNLTLLSENHIELMEELFLEKLMNDPSKNNTPMEKSVYALIDYIHTTNPSLIPQLKTELKNRPFFFRFTYVFSFASGVCMGFVSVSAFQAGLLTLGILSFIPGVFITILCIGAAIGYSLLMYQAIADLIMTNRLNEYWEKFKICFSRRQILANVQNKEPLSIWLGRCFLVSLTGIIFASLAIFATAATAGTFWYMAKDGLAILGKTVNVTVSCLSRTVTVMSAIPTLILNLVNPLPTAEQMLNFIGKFIKETSGTIKITIKETWNNEVKSCQNIGYLFGFLRFINPFRVTSSILNKTFYVGHLICIGAITGIPGAGVITNTTMGMLQEGLLHEPGDCDNRSFGLITRIVNIPILLCKISAVGWDWVMSGFESKINSWRKMFPVEIKEINQSLRVDPLWQQQELIMKLDKKIKALSTINLLKNDTIITKEKSLQNIRQSLHRLASQKLESSIENTSESVMQINPHSISLEKFSPEKISSDKLEPFDKIQSIPSIQVTENYATFFSQLRNQHELILNKKRYPLLDFFKVDKRTESCILLDEAEDIWRTSPVKQSKQMIVR